MSDYFKKIFDANQKLSEEDEEAYQEQLRAFNQAQEILKQQQFQEGGINMAMKININHQDIPITNKYQDGLDELLSNREISRINNADLTESTIENVKIRHRRQALSSMFYTVEVLQKIHSYIEEMAKKQAYFSTTFQEILKNDNKIRWVSSSAIDLLFDETK